MDYGAIRELVRGDPALATSEDWGAVAAALNVRDRTRRVFVGRDAIQNALMQMPRPGGSSLWFALRAMARAGSDPRAPLADAVVHVVQESLISSVNLDNPAVVGMLDALVATGLATEAERTAIRALGEEVCSRAEAAGLPVLSALDVRNAMTEVIP